MTVRLNHNISALNAQRHLERANIAQSKTLEHLSSGFKINTASDSPAALVISENMRAQIAGLSQAVENSEQGISMVQTAEGALGEVNRLLVDMRQLAIHAANAGVNDEKMLAADQAEIQNALETIDRISAITQFGTKRLLDGSRGANGVASGEALQFVDASPLTQSSPISGYVVRITQLATQSTWEGKTALTQEMVNAGETLTLSEGGKTITFTTKKGESVTSNLNELESRVRQAGLKLDLLRFGEGDQLRLGVRHQEYGSQHRFSVTSTTAGVLSEVANVTTEAQQGADVAGTINGEEAEGQGQILTGKVTSPNVAGLAVRYQGKQASAEGEMVGTVSVFQNSLLFQVGANEGQTVAVSVRNMAPRSLAQGVTTQSGFKSLNEISVMDFKGAQDALKMIDHAIDEVTSERGKLGAFQKNTLQSNLNHLRVAAENLTASESVIRDADMAREMSEFTRNQIMVQSSAAMLAQANQKERSVLTLLGFQG